MSPDPTPSPSVPTGIPRSRSAQTALASAVLFLVFVAGYRLFWPSATAHPTEDAPPRRRVDLNRADRSELLQIPGLGPSSADAILAHRAERGPFGSLDELTGVHGIGPKTTEKVKPWLNLSPSAEDPVERLERKPLPVPPPASGKGGTKISATDAKIDVEAASKAESLH